MMAALAMFLLDPGRALAHAPSANAGSTGAILGAWTFDPRTVVLLLSLGGLYGLSLRRSRRTRARFPRRRPLAFALGLLVLLLALAAPIDSYGDDLFWVHMLQHVLVMVVAAPLLVLGAPITLALIASSPRLRSTVLRPLLRSRVLRLLPLPPVTFAIFVGITWLWHVPALYDAAIATDALHGLEHVSFLSLSLLFWWLVIDAGRSRLRPPHPLRAALLLGAIAQGVVLGVILIGQDAASYDAYIDAAAARDWGPSAISDQRTGAGLIWIPAGLVYAMALIVTFHAWMDRQDERTAREDALRQRQWRERTG